jgi:hypothetical protein
MYKTYSILITNISSKSLAGWTFALSSYYQQNITKYLDDVYFQLLSVVIDPYSIHLQAQSSNRIWFYHLAYFYRFHNLKFLQFQAADDQYFPPDSEVIILFKYIGKTERFYLGLFLEWSSSNNGWFLSQVRSIRRKMKDIYFVSRRIPNIGHGLTGYEDSLASFYLSICTVSRYFYRWFQWNILQNVEFKSFFVDLGSNGKWNSWTNRC